jgi:hypothetical protein
MRRATSALTTRKLTTGLTKRLPFAHYIGYTILLFNLYDFWHKLRLKVECCFSTHHVSKERLEEEKLRQLQIITHVIPNRFLSFTLFSS